MARRHHHMPFGAAPLEDGRIHFRLWAPSARKVDVCLTRGTLNAPQVQAILPMNPEQDGWFSLSIDEAAVGSRYRYRIDGGMQVPDPASRFQPEDVHGPSEVIDPSGWSWQDTGWTGRRWEEAVIYELHVGSFTPQGGFAGVMEKLDYLADLGITAIELMPVADFPGRRNWGYDGVYPFAPDSRYGRPEDLKALVDAAHARGLMVLLDVVYNHFGPEGNYLHLYAPQFFTERHMTPWGSAINFDGEDSGWVRQFFIRNALYWLEEYHLDGLRLDAVHAMPDDARPDILTELAERVRRHFGDRRHIHLILENDHNAARYLDRDQLHRPRWYVAQWNDDLHHALHVLLTREEDGYYTDYADDPIRHLGRCLTEGFAYQGEPSRYRNAAPRGEPSAHLPPDAFVAFLQNHDQVGNRALGERIALLSAEAPLRAALALLLLAPAPPLLFMGQEWNSRQPFPFFCDFGADIAQRVVAGRRQEFARFAQFSDPALLARIPDPQAPQTFASAVLDWTACEHPWHSPWLEWHRELLAIRRERLMPRLRYGGCTRRACTPLAERALSASWTLGDGAQLQLLANLGEADVGGVRTPTQDLLFSTHGGPAQDGVLPPWSVSWYLPA